ncbi:MAG TPA: hypothetical protein VJW23_09990 [Propionibacteriaceae bacterium]|nr:hypothetical protein [Propionibacteriaceae bacterium]
MSTMTPEERMEVARVKLDAWLGDFAKLESPIDGALDDLGGWIDALEYAITDECGAHGKEHCSGCAVQAIRETRKMFDAFYELWEARA